MKIEMNKRIQMTNINGKQVATSDVEAARSKARELYKAKQVQKKEAA